MNVDDFNSKSSNRIEVVVEGRIKREGAAAVEEQQSAPYLTPPLSHRELSSLRLPEETVLSRSDDM
jgi:hypothetical protein